MAAIVPVRNGNTLYCAGNTGPTNVLTASNTNVTYIILTGGAAAGYIVLKDVTTTSSKLRVAVAANTTLTINLYDTPMNFPTGINAELSVDTLHLTLMVQSGGG